MGKTVAEDTVMEVSKEAQSPMPGRRIEIQLPSGYFSMLLAALFAAVLPWVIIMATCMVIYFSTANNMWLAETKWEDALLVGASIWSLSYGSVIQIGTDEGSFAISLVPLGVSFLMIFIGAVMSRQLLGKHRESIIYFLLNYVLLVGVLSLVVKTPTSSVQLLCGAFVIALLSSLFALRKDHRIQRNSRLADKMGVKSNIGSRFQDFFKKIKRKCTTISLKLRHLDYAYRDDLRKRHIGVDRDEFIYDGPKYSWSTPGWVISGIRLGWRIFTLLMLVALILLCVQLKLCWQDFNKLQDLTQASGSGIIVLLVGQLMYLPVFLIWGIAWYLGVGFYQGADFYRSIFTDSAGPYPVIPVFALMPHYQPGYWVLMTVVLASVLAGVIAYLNFARVDFFYHFATSQLAAISCAAMVLFLAWFSFGAIGPKNMQKWGAPPLFLTAILLLEVFVPFVLTFIVLHPKIRNGVKKAIASFKQRLVAIGHSKEKENSIEPNIADNANDDLKKTEEPASGVDKMVGIVTEEEQKPTEAEKVDLNAEQEPRKSNTAISPESDINFQTTLLGRGRLGAQGLSTEEIKEVANNW